MSDLKLLDLPDCPVAITALLIGDRWKILIIRELLHGEKRFNELRRGLTDISNKVLSQHLKMMEKRQIIMRKEKNEISLKVYYSLSDIGKSLGPVINEMYEFGEKYKLYLDSSFTQM